MYKNKEIHDLICALGIGEEGVDFRKNLNYHKIIILTDADVDGAHIRTLLLTFFFRYQKALFEEGVVYAGVPSLYKVERGEKATYCFDDNALKTLLKDYPDNCMKDGKEIFIVEGESAGGSAKQGRDRRFQAILPLRGKILNVERKDEEAMYKNKEIHDLICALGIGEEKALFEEGVVYVGVPPLYKVERGKKETYYFDDNALKTLLKDYPKNSSYNIQRFKGLGEMMPLQLWEITMNLATRKLKQLTIDDAEEADSVFTLLMGSNVEPRKKLIESSASKYMLENLDI